MMHRPTIGIRMIKIFMIDDMTFQSQTIASPSPTSVGCCRHELDSQDLEPSSMVAVYRDPAISASGSAVCPIWGP
jgi:hypothetical protein